MVDLDLDLPGNAGEAMVVAIVYNSRWKGIALKEDALKYGSFFFDGSNVDGSWRYVYEGVFCFRYLLREKT